MARGDEKTTDAIVVLGGSFCPLHAGHLAALETGRAMAARKGLRVVAGRRADGLARALRQGFGGHSRVGEHLAGRGVLGQHEGEEEVLWVDVGRSRGAGDLEGVEQRALVFTPGENQTPLPCS